MSLLPYLLVALLLQAGVFVGASIRRPWVSLACALIASPLSVVAAVLSEHRLYPMRVMFDLGHQSWSFMFIDGLVLAPAIYVGARYTKRINWAWVTFSMIVGFAGGFAFHTWDAGNYAVAGFAVLATRQSKLMHDFVSYAVLLSGLLGLAGPLVVGRKRAGYVMLVAVAVWMTFAGIDTARGLSPLWMHGDPYREVQAR